MVIIWVWTINYFWTTHEHRYFFFSRFLGPCFTDEKSYDLFLKPLLYIYFALRIVIKNILHDICGPAWSALILTSPVLGSTCGPLSLSQQGSPFSFSTLAFQTPCSYPLICFHIHGISPWCLVLLLWSYWLHDFHVHLWIPYSSDLYWSCRIDSKYKSDSQEYA